MQLNTNQLHYHGKGVFSEEISSLEELHGDSLPERWELKSQWTNNIIKMYYHHTDRDHEGDIVAWNYYGAVSSKRIEVTFFND